VSGDGSPVRVLLTAAPLDILGGQAVQARRLIEDISREPGVQIDFVPIAPRLPGAWRALQRVKYLRTAVTTPAFVWKLLRGVRRCQVVHAFSGSGTSFLLSTAPAILVARLYRKPILVHYHDGRAGWHLKHWRSARLLRLADRIVTPSEYLVRVFAEFGYKAHAIFNSLDLTRFRYRERRPERPVFLHNRGMEGLYNIPCALRAFALVQRRYPESSLIMANDGPLRGDLERMAAGMGLRNVHFVGQVPPERIAGLYDEADIYLTSSNIDNMPLSVLECYASGLPVVATEAGGIPYIARDGETALLVPLDDHEAMARSAIRLLEEDGLAVRLARAARYECERYTWMAVREEWLGLYGELSKRR
jgi:L-malate glycosyltransferase